jgi:hypothetical protein
LKLICQVFSQSAMLSRSACSKAWSSRLRIILKRSHDFFILGWVFYVTNCPSSDCLLFLILAKRI